MSRASGRKRIREEDIPEPGKYFDIVSLLSSYGGDLIRNNGGGDRVGVRRTLRGKHVMVCCFNVPVPAFEGYDSLVNLCGELYSERDDFEMVVVASMEYDDKEAFDYLLCRLLESCLAVPFGSWERCHYICEVLGLGVRRWQSVQCVFVNADGKVSRFCSFNNAKTDIFANYGAEAFPFTEEVIRKRDEECRRVVFEESSNLEAVLRCNDSSPGYVYRFGGGDSSRLRISQLKNKHVGLLMYSSGDLLNDLVEMYERCRKNKLDFEVVVVDSPFRPDIMSPRRLEGGIDVGLQQHFDTCRRWWRLPFNNSVSQRFWRMTRCHSSYKFWDMEEARCYHSSYKFWDMEAARWHHSSYKYYWDLEGAGDKLIVVGPSIKRLDMYGGEVMKCQEIDGYPFTTEAAIANKMKKLQECTLESLFAAGGDRVVPLPANKVFLFIRFVGGNCDLKTLGPVYHEVKERFGYQVVVVDVGGANVVPDEEYRNVEIVVTGEIESEMPRYVCPANKSMMELLRVLGMGCQALVGFGDDGRVCSLSNAGQDFEMCDTLYHQVEKFLGYHHLKNRRMHHL